MNLKFKALVYASGALLASVVAGWSFVEIIKMIPLAWVPWIGIGALIAMAFYVIYSISLSQLEYQARLKEVADRK